MLSRVSRIACIASRCSGRNSEKPHTLWSASRNRSSAADSRPVAPKPDAPAPSEGGLVPPKLADSASSEGGSASGVGVIDVVINQTLEFNREFVVAAAQSPGVLAVDEHRAARLLAGAGQADADVRRLRFAGTVDDAAHDREGHRLDALVLGFPGRHHLADIVLDPFGELLKRAAR